MLNIAKNSYFQMKQAKIEQSQKNITMRFYPSVSFKSSNTKPFVGLQRGLSLLGVNHLTNFNRRDINWSELVDFIDKKYPSHQYSKPVPIICHACSDNSEGYTILLEFLHKVKNFGELEKLKDRFSFIAKDIDPKIIDSNKKGHIKLSLSDIDYIKRQLKDTDTTFEDLFTARKTIFNRNLYKVSEKLRNMFEFSASNIVEEAEKPFNTENPSVILFRNAWYHLTSKAQTDLAQNLHKNLSPKSLLAIGECENNGDFSMISLLNQVGFKLKLENHVLPEDCVISYLFEKET